MPKKQMHIEHVPLSSDQRELYDKLKKKFCEEVRDVSDHPKRGGASMLMELRKAANHHLLLREKYDDKKLKQMAKQILKVRLRVLFVPRYRPRNYDLCFLFNFFAKNNVFDCVMQEPTHTECNEQFVFEDMQVMNDFELHRLCKQYKVRLIFTLDLQMPYERYQRKIK